MNTSRNASNIFASKIIPPHHWLTGKLVAKIVDGEWKRLQEHIRGSRFKTTKMQPKSARYILRKSLNSRITRREGVLSNYPMKGGIILRIIAAERGSSAYSHAMQII